MMVSPAVTNELSAMHEQARFDNGEPRVDSVSVIVPTVCEAENLPLLIPKVAEVLERRDVPFEIIVVDDNSPDDTVAVCERLAAEFPVRLHVRTTERGFSSAVISGMRIARGSILVVMNADLSHPAERIPELVDQLGEVNVDFVIGSRYVAGGATDTEWGWLRCLKSQIYTLLARPLTTARDPMAGFFALRRSLFLEASGRLNPVDYKIGLELIVKGNCQNVVEVPIHFSDRLHGKGKLTFNGQVNNLLHLKRLYQFRYPNWMSLSLFLCVGGTGMVLDLMIYGLLLTVVDIQLARGVAIFVAMTSNYLLNRQFTFSEVEKNGIVRRYFMYCLGCSCGAAVNWGMSVFLASVFPPSAGFKLVAAVIGIVAGTGLNYGFARFVVFREKKAVSSSFVLRCAAYLWPKRL